MKRAKVHVFKYVDSSDVPYWWFTVAGRNGRTLVTSETYSRHTSAMNAIKALAREGLKLEVADETVYGTHGRKRK